ncbi:MAG: hypothetical protein ACLQAL_03170, partial [Halobacteriota archaeon]
MSQDETIKQAEDETIKRLDALTEEKISLAKKFHPNYYKPPNEHTVPEAVTLKLEKERGLSLTLTSSSRLDSSRRCMSISAGMWIYYCCLPSASGTVNDGTWATNSASSG